MEIDGHEASVKGELALLAQLVRERAEVALDQLFRQIIAWNGAITGEHGVGIAKKRWWREAVPDATHEAHLRIKAALDPKGILNPGKFLG